MLSRPNCLPPLPLSLCSEGDFLFVGPAVFDQLEDAKREVQLPEYLANSRFHKVHCDDLFAICFPPVVVWLG